jgi:hypothetical protein
MGKQKNEDSKGFSHREGHKILKRFKVGTLVAYLKEMFPDRDTRPAGANRVKTNCLGRHITGHQDNNPSMYLNVETGVIRCSSCQYFTTNFLQALKDASGKSYRDILHSLRNKTSISIGLTSRGEHDADRFDVHQSALQAIYYACNRYLIGLVKPPVDGPDVRFYDVTTKTAAEPVLDWLFRQRGHKPERVRELPYGVWPMKSVLDFYVQQFLENRANEDYAAYANTALTSDRIELIKTQVGRIAAAGSTPDWVNSVAFFYGHDPRTLGRIRLRRPDINDVKDNNFLDLVGFREDEAYGFFGLWAPYLSGLTQSDVQQLTWFLGEGENDVLTSMELLLERGLRSYCVLCSGGSNPNAPDDLKTYAGIQAVNFLQDAQHGNGELWVKLQLKKAKQINVRVFRGWTEFHQAVGAGAKDVDEVIRLGGGDTFKRVVVDETLRWFAPVDVWALERAIEEINDVAENEVRERTKIACDFGKCVLDEAQFSQYVQRVCTLAGLTPAAVRKGIIQDADDDRGFTSLLADALRSEFELLYYQGTLRGSRVGAFHRERKQMLYLPLGDGQGICSELSLVVGDVIDWVDNQVGIPDWLLPTPQGDGQSVMILRPELQRQLVKYLPQALGQLVQGLPRKDDCPQLGAGIHVFPDTAAPQGWVFVVNNGNVFFELMYRDSHTNALVARKLDGPMWRNREGVGYLMMPAEKPHNPDLLSEADFEEGNSVSLEEIAAIQEQLQEAIGTGWVTLNTPIDSEMLSLYLLAYTASHFDENKVWIEITGQPNSGKSTAASMFSGGQVAGLALAGWAKHQSGYTEASLRSAFSWASQPICLDEFTDLGDNAPKSQIVRQVSEAFRQVTESDQGASLTKGSVDGTTRNWRIHAHIITTAITPATDPQDATRRFGISTIYQDGRASPASVMFERFGGPAGVRQVRRRLSIGLPKFFVEYRKHAKPIWDALDAGQIIKTGTRFLRNLKCTAPWYALFGKDWESLVQRVCASRAKHLEAVSAHNMPEQVFHYVLRTAAVRHGPTYTTPLALIASNGNQWPLLNQARCGVYYIPETEEVVVDWTAINMPGGLLYRVDAIRLNSVALKHQLDMHPHAVRPEIHEIDYGKILTALKPFGVFTQPGNISVLRLKSMIDDLRHHNKDRAAETPPQNSNRDDNDAPGMGQRRRPQFQ